LDDGTSLRVQHGGTTAGTQYDQVNIVGAAALDGTLDVSTGNGFTPAAGQYFTVLSATGGISGRFEELLGPRINPTTWLVPLYRADDLRLTVALPARLAANFHANGFDWIGGDFNGSGAVDISDFGLLAANFNQTVINGDVPHGDAAVPEPAAGVVGVVAGAFFVCRRRRR
jgi:hypothetical protein